MNRSRFALITRRFWPLVGGAERAMANLACEFQDAGNVVQIVTARWEKTWPTDIIHREIPVHRLAQPKTRAWGTLRYMQALGRWVRQHHQTIDGLIVSRLKHDAHVAVRVGHGLGIPVVVRAEGGGDSGDYQWQERAKFGLRIREMTRHCDAWVASCQSTFDELVGGGYPAERGHLIPNGVELPPVRTEERRQESRRSLAEAHSILAVAPDEPLVVYTGRLAATKGLFELIEAWGNVVLRWPRAKLWLTGDGNDAHQVWKKIVSRELTHTIILPGSFDDPNDLFYAADAFVQPSFEEGMSLALAEAMAAGVPTISCDIPSNRKLVDSEVHGLLVPPRDPSAMAKAMIRVLDDPDSAQRLALNARQRIQDQYSLETMAERHLEVIGHVIDSRARLMRQGGRSE